MRIGFFLFFCFFCTSLWSQDTKLVRLKVLNADCIPEVSSSPFVDVALYKLPEDTFVFRTEMDVLNGQDKVEALLLPGRYIARYNNIAGQRMEREIELGRKDTAIGFCVDSLKYYPLNTLACFKEKDSMVLSCSYSGCFEYGRAKIVIKYSNNVFTASLYTENEGEPLIHKKTVRLNTAQVLAFRRFENELIVVNNVNDGTTSVSYHITSPYLNIAKGDEAIYWGGYRDLCSSLFDVEDR